MLITGGVIGGIFRFMIEFLLTITPIGVFIAVKVAEYIMKRDTE